MDAEEIDAACVDWRATAEEMQSVIGQLRASLHVLVDSFTEDGYPTVSTPSALREARRLLGVEVS